MDSASLANLGHRTRGSDGERPVAPRLDGDTPGGSTGAGGDGVAIESWGDRPLAV